MERYWMLSKGRLDYREDINKVFKNIMFLYKQMNWDFRYIH